MTDRSERRAHKRWPIDQKGVVLVEGRAHTCRATDVSKQGMRLAVAEQLEVGTMVIVELSGLLPFKGRVARASAGVLGLHFADPIQYSGIDLDS